MPITHEHNTDEELSDLQRLQRAVISCMPAIIAENSKNAFCPTDLPLADTIGLEGIYLAAQVGMLLLRGASVATIEQHIANGSQLPFEGAERGMFHALLDELTERFGDRAYAARKAIKLAENFDSVLAILERDGSVSRETILTVVVESFANTQTSETGQTDVVGCFHCSCSPHDQGVQRVRAE